MIFLSILFFFVALLYSMAGFGGGSSYNALLVLFNINYQIYPSIALICNLIVVSGGCWLFYKRGEFSIKLLLPFIISSVPMAHITGRLLVDKTSFLIVLGLALFAAGLIIMFNHKLQTRVIPPKDNPDLWRWGLPIGAGLGSLAGFVGVGGGIFLAPILYLLGWGTARQIAAAASGFILVNSIAGLSGHYFKLQDSVISITQVLDFWPAYISVFIGGQIGSRLSRSRLSPQVIQALTATLVLYVSLRIGWHLIRT